jgi:protein TonB
LKLTYFDSRLNYQNQPETSILIISCFCGTNEQLRCLSKRNEFPTPIGTGKTEENNFMLDQLVESSSHRKETARRGGFMLSTLVVVCSVFLSGILWSLFAKDLKMGEDDLEISTLVAPVPMPEDAPRQPEPVAKMEKQEQSQKVVETTRQANIMRIDESPNVSAEISTVPNTQKARPNGNFKISEGLELEAQGLNSATRGGENNVGGVGVGLAESSQPMPVEKLKIKETPPPPPLTKEIPKPPVNAKKSLGVINGKATNLVKPTYSPAALAVRAAGEVNVQVTIDEKGNVISANAVSGHVLLRPSAETAARASKFNPTLLSLQPVKVTGLIVYKFAPK